MSDDLTEATEDVKDDPTEEPAGSWESAEYVTEWTSADAFTDVLDLPRRVSVGLVEDTGLTVEHVVDLGAGEGRYLEVLLQSFPRSRGTWVDASEPMLDRARERLDRFGSRVEFLLTDVRGPAPLPDGRADVIVSSRVIHHFEPETIRRLYHAAFDRLGSGGFLFNLDHVGVPDEWEERYRRVREKFFPRRRPPRPHEHDAPPQPLADHLRWLTEAGFEPPEVPWRLFFSALLAARKPPAG